MSEESDSVFRLVRCGYFLGLLANLAANRGHHEIPYHCPGGVPRFQPGADPLTEANV